MKRHLSTKQTACERNTPDSYECEISNGVIFNERKVLNCFIFWLVKSK